jgi:deoxycytidine triphosphate deaminase
VLIHIASPDTFSHVRYQEGSEANASDIQPNALDIRLDKVFRLVGPFTIDNDTKIHRTFSPIAPDDNGYYNLYPGYYSITLEGTISIGADEAGHVITRSTFVRNGVFIISGLYDSGYCGPMAAGLHVTTDVASIKKGTRIGQFLLYKAQSVHQYNGDYGNGSETDKKLYGV